MDSYEQMIALSAVASDIAYAREVKRQGFDLDVFIGVMTNVLTSGVRSLGLDEEVVLPEMLVIEITDFAKNKIKEYGEVKKNG